MTTRPISLVSAALAITATVLAQDPNDRQGGPPMGPPPGMAFGVRGGGGLPSTGMLLRRKDVQEDLQLTNEQKTKIEDILDSMRPPGPGGPGGPGGFGGPGGPGGGGPGGEDDGPPMGGPPMGGGPGGDPGGPGGPPPSDAFLTWPIVAISIQGGGPGPQGGPGRGRFEEMEKKLNTQINQVLTQPQRVRLHEIAIQVAGNTAITDATVQTEIGLTAAQKAKVKSLTAKQREASQAIFEKVRNGELEREEIGDLMRKNNDIMKAELGKVLTEVQRQKLVKLGGKTFKATEEVRN